MPFVWGLIDSGLAKMKNILIAFEVFGPTCSEWQLDSMLLIN
jgi:hypothetical protein